MSKMFLVFLMAISSTISCYCSYQDYKTAELKKMEKKINYVNKCRNTLYVLSDSVNRVTFCRTSGNGTIRATKTTTI